MAFETKVKDPADVVDYLINWRPDTNPVLAEDEIVTDSTWTAYDLPAGKNPQDPTFEWEESVDFVVDSDSFTDTATTVWTSAGVRGAKYLLTNHIRTDQGREFDFTILIKMKEN